LMMSKMSLSMTAREGAKERKAPSERGADKAGEPRNATTKYQGLKKINVEMRRERPDT
jgi:hypothetical protein